MILLQLSVQDLFYSKQASKTFAAAICSSTKLERKLFLKADENVVFQAAYSKNPTRVLCKPGRFTHSFQRYIFNPLFIKNSINTLGELVNTLEPAKTIAMIRKPWSKYQRDLSTPFSCKNIFITRPAIHAILVHTSWNGRTPRLSRMSRISGLNGITCGHVLAETKCMRTVLGPRVLMECTLEIPILIESGFVSPEEDAMVKDAAIVEDDQNAVIGKEGNDVKLGQDDGEVQTVVDVAATSAVSEAEASEEDTDDILQYRNRMAGKH